MLVTVRPNQQAHSTIAYSRSQSLRTLPHLDYTEARVRVGGLLLNNPVQFYQTTNSLLAGSPSPSSVSDPTI
jgi:hypothetical protein